MESKELIRTELEKVAGMVLKMIDGMRDSLTTFPTPRGGCHPLWVLGHIAYSQGVIIDEFVLGESNPLAEWKDIFGDGTEPVDDASAYPPYEVVVEKCQEAQQRTLKLLESQSEADLDAPSKNPPPGYESYFGTRRQCFQMVANHWWMHRAHVADARRAAGLTRKGP